MPSREKDTSADPLWFKDAIIYELHIKTFADGNGDGIGDFRGLLEKLDYLQELGVTALWLLPFYPSPLRDDGYDIADYFEVNSNYGTLEDFRVFLAAAHARGLRVITELVINHSSDQNPLFQKSRRAQPGSPEREMYVWSDSPEKYNEARIIFKDFETSNWSWDPLAKAYYWHRFYSHQPDLNFDNPAVHDFVQRVCDFWLEMGVDGLRLDAVPYLYEREGTNCENLPETHAYLKKLRAHVDAKYRGRMLLAEANQWPEDAVTYFGDGDESHMNFHFPLMPRMFMALQMEDRFPILDILEQTPAIPENCQWAMFLRNHDELTLEMVTDEERDYMWRVYATDPTARINLGIRRRLAPLLANSRRKIELLNVLLFSMPGTPVLYYGDEIGMGDNIYLGDRNGCRTPMQWSSDRNAGFSRANPQQLFLPIIIDPEYHYEAINVENQQKNLSSLLWWTRRVIAMRRNFKAFSRGTLEFLSPDNPKVLAFVRQHEDETILVVVNLSRFAQPAQLDLARFKGRILREVFSQNIFPAIGSKSYPLTLGPHGYFWFRIQAQPRHAGNGKKRSLPTLAESADLETLLREQGEAIERNVLPDYLRQCRWFGGKARTLRQVKVAEVIPMPGLASIAFWILRVDYIDAASESYSLPVQIVSADDGSRLLQSSPSAVIARLGKKFLCDAVWDDAFRKKLFAFIAQDERARGREGELVGSAPAETRAILNGPPEQSKLHGAEQTNSSMVFDGKTFLKLYRRLEDGANPDVEVTRFLTTRAQFPNVPSFYGALEYRRGRGEPVVVGLLQQAVNAESDAWMMTLDAVGRYYERVLARKSQLQETPLSRQTLLPELVGAIYAERAKLLGQRTAEMHLALASVADDRAFAPEPFNALAQRSVFQNMRASLKRTFDLLRRKIPALPEKFRDDARRLLDAEQIILARERHVLDRRTVAMKIRIHGDYHLGQALYTGKDFVILDFEGEPARSLGERKMKRSALRDVAGMMRSFQYAAYSGLWQATVRPEDVDFLEHWADIWYREMSSEFLGAYLRSARAASFLPASEADLHLLLEAYLLDKAIYEIGYELNNRPDWVIIPLRGIQHLLRASAHAPAAEEA
ncbi:MAG: maltose alpha-D-glucosyltransferase [Verrucomicrobiota bacterium]|nr:maltose alpha-D-glucosyltransferase [Verrucomicrobiota bacterium]